MTGSSVGDDSTSVPASQANAILDADDVGYLVQNLSISQLRHELHRAGNEGPICQQFGDSWEFFWRDYHQAVALAINIAKSDTALPERRGSNRPPLVRDVKSRNDVADVIGQYVKLMKSGQNLRGLCPFHHDRKPSFIVYPSDQRWWCFSCNQGGDICDFTMRYHGLDFRGALDFLSGRKR